MDSGSRAEVPPELSRICPTWRQRAVRRELPHSILLISREDLAHPTGFEPVTSAFGGQRSIQLSYGCSLRRAGSPDRRRVTSNRRSGKRHQRIIANGSTVAAVPLLRSFPGALCWHPVPRVSFQTCLPEGGPLIDREPVIESPGGEQIGGEQIGGTEVKQGVQVGHIVDPGSPDRHCDRSAGERNGPGELLGDRHA